MKIPSSLFLAFVLSAVIRLPLAAVPVGTAFTYQGRLNDSAQPANGIYDLRFTIYDMAANGNTVGNPLTNSATGVTNGLFTVTLDFGAGVFNGQERWLEIAVRTNGAVFSTLTPRQSITPTPYSIAAANLTGALPVSQLAGSVPLAQLPPILLTNNATGVALSGTFS
ncbi:MAG TPA: hypothetical protein VK327_14800, partial [Candidatus Paceibacterota bacterium]|nr:hypothetical protein [Candidatus Paceibacterota bacterium]